MRFHIGLAALLVSFCVILTPVEAQRFHPQQVSRGQAAPVTSRNFVVYAADPVMARKVSQEAERYRKQLAVEWLGKELPNWNQKCPITVELGRHAGGETSFAFVTNRSGRGQPIDWQMKIYGPHDRILDAVLPHEITHTIFATHFGQPLPRWADEGACTTVEHVSERKKNHAMLMDFLHAQPSRGLPFNRMFTMRNYPQDILPLYAQGYSVAKFLILQKGKRYFLDYVGKGLQNEATNPPLRAWDRATAEFYDYKDLSDLQVSWLDWVRKGSAETAFLGRGADSVNAIARADVKPGNAIRQASNNASVSSNWKEAANGPATADSTYTSNPTGSWYAQQMKQASADRVATNREDFAPTKARKVRGADEQPVGPVVADSSLPIEFRPTPKTIWR